MVFRQALYVIILVFALSSPVAAKDTVVLQLRFDHQFQFAGYYAAQWQGYYEAAGLEVDIRPGIRPQGTMISASQEVGAQRADFGVGSGDVLVAIDQGVPLVLVASIFQQSPVEIYAHPGVQLDSPADLSRLRVQDGQNPYIDVEVQSMLRLEGIDPQSVSLIRAPQPRPVLEHLEDFFSGQVDVTLGYAFSIPWYAKQRGMSLTRLRPSAYGVDFYGDSLFTNRELVQKNPGLVERFTTASLKGWHDALEHPDDIIDKIATELPRVLPVDDLKAYNRFLAEKVRQLTLHPIVELGHLNPRRWQVMQDAMQRAGLIQNRFTVTDAIFAPEIHRAQRRESQLWLLVMVLGVSAGVGVALTLWSRRSQRKQAEEAMRRSEAQTRAILDTAVDSMISITEKGDILSFNPAAERLFGYRAEEVQGQNVNLLMPSPYREAHDGYLAHYRRTGEKKIIGIGREVIGKRKDGTTFPMDLAVGEARIGEQRLFTGIVRDITERKQAEAALRQAHDELELRVRERTAALEIANEEVRRFAYIVSHDLRAPLINLKGFAGELRDLCDLLKTVLPRVSTHLEEPQRTEIIQAVTEYGPEALEFIETSVTRMDGLIRAILDLSRAGQRELQIEPVDTEALAKHIRQTLTHQLTQANACMTIEPLPIVNADYMAMEQILGNLLGNAVKYLEPGRRGEIAVRAECGPDVTTLQVRDNGRGIAEDDVPRVFELFRRVGRQDAPGEGMGLAYVQTLVRRHGGEITCQSALGVGTTFSFTIANHLAPEEPDVTSLQHSGDNLDRDTNAETANRLKERG